MQTDGDNIERKITDLLRQQTGAEKIIEADCDADITKLVGIDGADATDFLKRYATAFHVDMTNFIHNKYFSNEGFDLAEIILNLLWKKHVFAPLTIKRLADIAKAGKWPLEPDGEYLKHRAEIGSWINRGFFLCIFAFIMSRFF